MITLLRKTSQATYTFSLDLLDMEGSGNERKEYLATLIYQGDILVSSSVSYKGEEVEDYDKKEQMIYGILLAYEEELPTKK